MRIECFEHFDHFKFLALGAFASGLGLNAFESCLFVFQDIFECRTCGLTDSLCCCTECAKVCHKGHECKLKKTSPTAYCDCWEKCKCKSTIAGHQGNRYDVLSKLISEAPDLVKDPNSRGENILLFLVQTVGRQQHEQRNGYRPTSR